MKQDLGISPFPLLFVNVDIAAQSKLTNQSPIEHEGSQEVSNPLLVSKSTSQTTKVTVSSSSPILIIHPQPEPITPQQ